MLKKLLISIISIVFLMSGCSYLTSNDEQRIPVKVEKVVDGDTIKVRVDGKLETVRFLLVDTPESVHPSKPIQPFSKEASKHAGDMLKDADVQLELGIGERDKYGRLLAYVYADGKSVQESLLKKGLARVAYVFEPNTKYVDQYESIQKQAQKEGVGIWSLENYVQEDGYVSDNDEDKPEDQAKNEDCTIKGNISSSGGKIYHLESGRYYKVTKPEKWFCTEKEAMDSGFRKSKQ
ncbi:thermonuclease family protein [Fictibacillus norfolkensis]|uniref:Thermonuclease family protein n=1 Tax=Fictibacillus norfolkensis TaxID=2762233 RepID=A0ABR8SIH4_9BACL|nr:thermonuclease family protein [Fictibacillus norfolkensis]MBD7963278.1 thermonuclease family protein [Fictibacillus norfolkensis]